MPVFHTKNASNTAGNNVQVQVVITMENLEELNLIFESVGGNFASQNATVEVSTDNSIFHTIDSAIALGTSNKVAKFYDGNNKGTTLALDPCGFPYVRVTIPQLGASIAGKLTYSGLRKNSATF